MAINPDTFEIYRTKNYADDITGYVPSGSNTPIPEGHIAFTSIKNESKKVKGEKNQVQAQDLSKLRDDELGDRATEESRDALWDHPSETDASTVENMIAEAIKDEKLRRR